jgi:hypothetical protein
VTIRSNLGGDYGAARPVNVDAEAEYAAFDALPAPIRERLNAASFKILASTVLPHYRRRLELGASEDEAVAWIVQGIERTERAATGR